MFLRAIHAENLKYRRHVTLWLAAGVPLAVAFLGLLMFTLADSLRSKPPELKWGLMIGQLVPLWSILVLPLGASILASLATSLETAENHLKQVLVLPPSRTHVYAAKLVAILAVIFIGTLTLGIGMLAVGLILGFAGPIPWHDLFVGPLTAYLGGLPTIALSAWLGLRFHSFAVPVGVGLAGSIAGSFAFRSSQHWAYVPWTYPIIAQSGTHGAATLAAWLAVALGALLLAGGLLDFQRRDVQ